ncbi:hypothetical protein F8M41_020173 [Gigaspora margarita]|uniref:Uncharacterized protein n=1 Tax=Gigaspora margarita TaxID=4874 RepID=A0A8H4EJU9_GIGMA|nr:hypothetical protein F8M41_020173 [Gigaspora margarita]
MISHKMKLTIIKLIAENEHWKNAVEGFAAAVQKNIKDASQKIIEKIDEIDGDDNENNTRHIDYDEIKRRAKEAAAKALAKVQDFLPNLSSDVGDLLNQISKHDQAIQKFGELTGAYKKLQAENKFLRESIKTMLDEINGKLNIDTLALNLTNGLNPLFESSDIKVNYETIKQKCKEALEEMQDFLGNIPADVDELLNQLPPPSS